MNLIKYSVFIALVSLFPEYVFANVKLASPFGDHMVLQRNKTVPVWGTASPGEEVTITFIKQKKSIITGSDGTWCINLSKLAAGGPFTLTATGTNTITLQDVYVGEVWICSGQSNMDFTVARENRYWCGVFNEKQEVVEADYPLIRVFDTDFSPRLDLQKEVTGTWEIVSPETVGHISAIAYFFARDLQKKLKVPIGLITTAFGASTAEAWISKEALQSNPQFATLLTNFQDKINKYLPDTAAQLKYRKAYDIWIVAADKAKAEGKDELRGPKDPDPVADQHNPFVLWNGMVAPLVPYAIQGALWYQGESNSPTASIYRDLMETLIVDWRKQWNQGDFPFIYVQLANIGKEIETTPAKGGSEAVKREAQLLNLSIPKTAMVVAIDNADPLDMQNVHPKNKQEIGRRIVLAARAIAYGEKITYSGPLYEKMEIIGNTIHLKFKSVDAGLIYKGDKLHGFAIAGEDKKFVWADAKIEGNSVIVSSSDIANPIAVRYGWGSNPPVSLYNKADLPASPFRTDAGSQAIAQRQMEYLDRGVIAIHKANDSVFIGWRMLETESDDIAFNIYRQSGNEKPVRLNKTPIKESTNYEDENVNFKTDNSYFVKVVLKGAEQEASKSFTLKANTPAQQYINISLKTPEGYTPNDASVGDLDGDGEYEVILHQTGRGIDTPSPGISGIPIFQAYKMDGTLLWEINLGKNIREGAHYTQFMVYDLDGDGISEFSCKTADGTIDGIGNVIGDSTKDWRNLDKASGTYYGKILDGPEFFTIFSGRTGEKLATTTYIPNRYPLNGWNGHGGNGGSDSTGNRVDRFLACVAYLDGVHPSVVMCRGYYGRSVLAAWDWRSGKLTSRWVFDSRDGENPYSGQGNHNLSVADVDGDGRDEIIYGSMVVDDNGKGLFSTGFRHGDAIHVGVLNPDRTGLQVFGVHEIEEKTTGPGATVYDAKTGEVLYKGSMDKDVGRGVAEDIDPSNPGAEMWFSGSNGLLNMKGERIGDTPSSTNFLIWWDGDLSRELLDGNHIDKYKVGRLFTAEDCVSNNGTKSTPALSADLFGDWREEVIFRTADNQNLRIYTTTLPTKHRIYTLMHDPQYRLAIATQNVAYNQPPHTGFSLGTDMKKAPKPNITFTLPAQKVQETSRKILNFDNDWRFLKDDAKGAEIPSFDDSKWRKLDVPHDWSIEGPYDNANTTSRGGGYLPAGIGWYRKSFTVNEADAKQKVFIEFDGVMANSDVWINGFHLGKRPYGYTSFSYDLAGHLKSGKGESNILSVRADNSNQPASRYYTGAGIYRHVRLVVTNPLHIDQWSVYISSSQVSDKKALINFQAKVNNETSSLNSIIFETTIFDPSGKIVKSVESKQSVPSGKSVTINQTLEVADPQLWDIVQPNLYKAITRIKFAKNTIDEQTSTFGIRESKFEAATGYWLNGKNIKIKGVCLHHDGGAFGSAVPLRAWERRLELLKDVGVNAIRTAHNPVAPEFLDLCDRMGFLVMDETFDTWTASKPNGEKGYNQFFTQWWEKDTRDLVLRDRNHPSIIIYSVGNEIRDNLNDSTGFKKYKDQQDLIHQLDPGRPVTMALFRPGTSKVYLNGFVDKMDIVGQNYREKELVDAHLAKPERIVIGTENGHGLTEWLIMRNNPFMSGQFLWAGIDYLGEALWPSVSSRSGLFDRTGGWKPITFQRLSWWADKPVVHIVRKDGNAGEGEWVSNWTPVDLGTYDDARVQVYSNCDEVELFLNDKSLGAITKPADDSPRSWEVTFEKGNLKAVAKNKGIEVASDQLKTAGKPARIILTADKSTITKNWDDVSYITAIVVDADGITCPHVDKLISFKVSESGTISAVDNGDINSHEAYQASERHIFHSQCIAIIKAKTASGKIIITASSPELISGSVTLEVNQ